MNGPISAHTTHKKISLAKKSYAIFSPTSSHEDKFKNRWDYKRMGWKRRRRFPNQLAHKRMESRVKNKKYAKHIMQVIRDHENKSSIPPHVIHMFIHPFFGTTAKRNNESEQGYKTKNDCIIVRKKIFWIVASVHVCKLISSCSLISHNYVDWLLTYV